MEMSMNFNLNDRAFYNGEITDYRKRQWDREDKERYNLALGEAFMNTKNELLLEETNNAYEEYSKSLQQA
jgi:hypothetical protein